MGVIKEVVLTPLRIIPGDSGEVLHALKQNEISFQGFGEAYFSTVRKHAVKGWKKHRRMLLNLVVPSGVIRFVLYDDRPESKSFQTIQEVVLSKENYQRLTVPPGVWMAFQGMSDELNILLNIASIPHDPAEADSLPLRNGLIPYPGFS
ncbi:MAG TPA: dTDP-4-dehydrorhamnose 3,5-epimerase family protein [Puia sp.]|jgi:dTDP-4-dehydrorhamnose 3,5-epimerase